MEDAKLSVRQIDEVVLVGGSTRIPKIRSLIEEYFSGILGTVCNSMYALPRWQSSKIFVLNCRFLLLAVQFILSFYFMDLYARKILSLVNEFYCLD